MPFEFDKSPGAHIVVSFRAFVHDNGMPGVRFTKESGEYLDLVFSVPATQELQTQCDLARQLAAGTKRH